MECWDSQEWRDGNLCNAFCGHYINFMILINVKRKRILTDLFLNVGMIICVLQCQYRKPQK